CEVIASSLGDHEQHQRDQVHPCHCSKTLAHGRDQIEVESREEQWRSEQQEVSLFGEEILRPADSHIARVYVLQEVERDKRVLRLPNYVRQKNQERGCHSVPEPSASEGAPRIGQYHSREQARNQK